MLPSYSLRTNSIRGTRSTEVASSTRKENAQPSNSSRETDPYRSAITEEPSQVPPYACVQCTTNPSNGPKYILIGPQTSISFCRAHDPGVAPRGRAHVSVPCSHINHRPARVSGRNDIGLGDRGTQASRSRAKYQEEVPQFLPVLWISAPHRVACARTLFCARKIEHISSGSCHDFFQQISNAKDMYRGHDEAEIPR